MNLQATSDRAFGSGRSIDGEHWWRASSAPRAESLFSCALALSYSRRFDTSASVTVWHRQNTHICDEYRLVTGARG